MQEGRAAYEAFMAKTKRSIIVKIKRQQRAGESARWEEFELR